MNAFQKLLLLGDRCMAEISGQHRDGIGLAIPPAKVSVEEFFSDATIDAECMLCHTIHPFYKFTPRQLCYVLYCDKCQGSMMHQPRLTPAV